jgi:hypothetical protein
MLRLVLLGALLMPSGADAGMWGWRDPSGGYHYSNVPGRVPAHAVEVRTDVGHVSTEPVTPPGHDSAPVTSRSTERLRAERVLRRRLAEIESFYAAVRRRQRQRLESWPNVTLLADWMVADRWLQLQDEEAKLLAALARLEKGNRS